MGPPHRRSGWATAGRKAGVPGATEKAKAGADLVLEDLERAHESRHARCRKAEAREPADTYGLCAERDRLDHVGAAHEAAVDPDLRAAIDRLEDLGQDG